MIAAAAALAAACAGAAPAHPAAPAALTATAWSGPGQVGYSLLRPAEGGQARIAYRMTRDEEGKPFLEAYSFLVMDVAFSLAGQLYPWPVICDEFWTWDDVGRRFVHLGGSWTGGNAPCSFQGTVYFKATLIPRSEVRPVVEAAIEGPQGTVTVPVRILLDERRQTDWTGIPVVLGQICTTELDDGVQRLRLAGGWRGYQIDADPGTPEFDPGGDANATFVVQNGPPRLMRVRIVAGSATAYEGSWTRDSGALVFTRTGGMVSWARGSTGPQARVFLTFSVPVGQVAADLVRADGTAVALSPGHGGSAEDPCADWEAALDAGEIGKGAWTLRVSAKDSAGRDLELLAPPRMPAGSLGALSPETGDCAAGGRPCALGPDVTHRISVRPGMMAHGR